MLNILHYAWHFYTTTLLGIKIFAVVTMKSVFIVFLNSILLLLISTSQVFANNCIKQAHATVNNVGNGTNHSDSTVWYKLEIDPSADRIVLITRTEKFNRRGQIEFSLVDSNCRQLSAGTSIMEFAPGIARPGDKQYARNYIADMPKDGEVYVQIKTRKTNGYKFSFYGAALPTSESAENPHGHLVSYRAKYPGDGPKISVNQRSLLVIPKSPKRNSRYIGDVQVKGGKSYHGRLESTKLSQGPLTHYLDPGAEYQVSYQEAVQVRRFRYKAEKQIHHSFQYTILPIPDNFSMIYFGLLPDQISGDTIVKPNTAVHADIARSEYQIAHPGAGMTTYVTGFNGRTMQPAGFNNVESPFNINSLRAMSREIAKGVYRIEGPAGIFKATKSFSEKRFKRTLRRIRGGKSREMARNWLTVSASVNESALSAVEVKDRTIHWAGTSPTKYLVENASRRNKVHIEAHSPALAVLYPVDKQNRRDNGTVKLLGWHGDSVTLESPKEVTLIPFCEANLESLDEHKAGAVCAKTINLADNSGVLERGRLWMYQRPEFGDDFNVQISDFTGLEIEQNNADLSFTVFDAKGVRQKPISSNQSRKKQQLRFAVSPGKYYVHLLAQNTEDNFNLRFKTGHKYLTESISEDYALKQAKRMDQLGETCDESKAEVIDHGYSLLPNSKFEYASDVDVFAFKAKRDGYMKLALRSGADIVTLNENCSFNSKLTKGSTLKFFVKAEVPVFVKATPQRGVARQYSFSMTFDANNIDATKIVGVGTADIEHVEETTPYIDKDIGSKERIPNIVLRSVYPKRVRKGRLAKFKVHHDGGKPTFFADICQGEGGVDYNKFTAIFDCQIAKNQKEGLYNANISQYGKSLHKHAFTVLPEFEGSTESAIANAFEVSCQTPIKLKTSSKVEAIAFNNNSEYLNLLLRTVIDGKRSMLAIRGIKPNAGLEVGDYIEANAPIGTPFVRTNGISASCPNLAYDIRALFDQDVMAQHWDKKELVIPTTTKKTYTYQRAKQAVKSITVQIDKHGDLSEETCNLPFDRSNQAKPSVGTPDCLFSAMYLAMEQRRQVTLYSREAALKGLVLSPQDKYELTTTLGNLGYIIAGDWLRQVFGDEAIPSLIDFGEAFVNTDNIYSAKGSPNVGDYVAKKDISNVFGGGS